VKEGLVRAGPLSSGGMQHKRALWFVTHPTLQTHSRCAWHPGGEGGRVVAFQESPRFDNRVERPADWRQTAAAVYGRLMRTGAAGMCLY
jgi:hypothetical protein